MKRVIASRDPYAGHDSRAVTFVLDLIDANTRVTIKDREGNILVNGLPVNDFQHHHEANKYYGGHVTGIQATGANDVTLTVAEDDEDFY